MIYLDEACARWVLTVRRMWAMKGCQPEIMSPTGRQNVKLMGALDPATGEIFVEAVTALKAPEFQQYLSNLLAHFGGTGKIWVILDNARVHHAKLLKPFLAEVKDRLELVFLPPYSPDLNPIERVWRFLRSEKLHDTYYATFPEFREAILSFCTKYATPNDDLIRLCANA